MKKLIKTSRTAGHLEMVFRTLNSVFFDDVLEEPVITINSSPRTYGHVTTEKVWMTGAESVTRYELNISAETLNRPVEAIVATVMHECCHLLNLQNGVQDCSRQGHYHNKKFRDVAQVHGLIVEYSKKYGWGITKPNEELIEFAISQGWKEIEMNKIDIVAADKDKPGGETVKKNTARKYQCPKCKSSVRATKEVNVICANCNMTMEWVNK